MPRQFFLIILALVYVIPCFAQGGFTQMGTARSRANGYNTENFRDANAVFHNQAGSAFVDRHTWVLSGENRFLLSGLTHGLAGYILPTKTGNFSLMAGTYGNEHYRENKIGIGYARKLTKETAIGAQVNYMFVQVAEGGTAGAVNMDLGIQQKILDYLSLGFQVCNPVRRSFANGYTPPTIFRLGSQLTLSEKVILLAGIEKQTDWKENIKLGLEYNLHPNFIARAGLQTQPRSVAAGFGLKIHDKIFMDFAAEWQSIIGISPAFTCLFSI
jgi:hypothetical protein